MCKIYVSTSIQMFNLAFISHFYDVVICIIQKFQTQDMMLAAASRA